VAVIEREHLGGICLNWGCIPTKALLRISEIITCSSIWMNFGLSAKDAKFDISKVVKRSRDVAGQLSGGVKHLLKKNRSPSSTPRQTAGQGQNRRGRREQTGKFRPRISSLPPAPGRAACRAGTRRQVVWTYKESHGAAQLSEITAGRWQRRDRHRIRSFYRTLGAEVTW